LLKNKKKQSSPPSSSRSNELGTLLPWTSTGTSPLVFVPAQPSATELARGLTEEVEITPEMHTSLKGLLMAKDFCNPWRIAEKMLLDVVLELRCHSRSPAAASSPSLVTTLELEEESKEVARGQTRAAEVFQLRIRETDSPSNPRHLPRARGGKRRRW
jgi:hypothetical protein